MAVEESGSRAGQAGGELGEDGAAASPGGAARAGAEAPGGDRRRTRITLFLLLVSGLLLLAVAVSYALYRQPGHRAPLQRPQDPARESSRRMPGQQTPAPDDGISISRQEVAATWPIPASSGFRMAPRQAPEG